MFIGKDMHVESYANIIELLNIFLDIKEKKFNGLYAFEQLESKLKEKKYIIITEQKDLQQNMKIKEKIIYNYMKDST